MWNKPLNLAVAGLLVLFCGLYVYTGKQADKYAQTAVPWLEQNMPAITTWKVEETWKRLAPEAKAIIDQRQLDAIINRYELMGIYKGMESPEFSRLASALSVLSGDAKINYSAKTHFSNADAILTITLVQRQGEFMIYNMNLGEMTVAKD